MKVALFIILALFLVGVLSGIAWKRIKSRAKKVDLVAKSNHRSLWSFHYGPAPVVPVREPAKAAPALTPDNPLSQLMPQEDFEAKQEKEIAEEAARIEAEQMAEREAAQAPAPVAAAAENAASESAPALVKEPDREPAGGPAATPTTEPTDQPVTAPANAPAPVLLSSRHAPGATVNVFDVLGQLGNDEPAPARADAPESAAVPASVETPVVGAPGAASQPVAAPAALDDEPVDQAIYDNPVSATTAAPTKNDKANTQAAVTLRQHNRAALQARLDAQKTAMSAFTTDNKKSR